MKFLLENLQAEAPGFSESLRLIEKKGPAPKQSTIGLQRVCD
jgi:hypothetical protein